MTAYFIAGTDTGVGKTRITGLLAKLMMDKGSTVVTQKWTQTGSIGFPDDIATHLSIMGVDKTTLAPYMRAICPYQFKLPASAHLAAQQEGVTIDVNVIDTAFRALTRAFDVVLVEGIGGVHVPFSDSTTCLDIMERLAIPVILVIDNKLGAINHSLLTIDALTQRRIPIVGLVMNQTTPDEDPVILRDNPRIIETLSGISVIGSLGFNQKMTGEGLESVVDVIGLNSRVLFLGLIQ